MFERLLMTLTSLVCATSIALLMTSIAHADEFKAPHVVVATVSALEGAQVSDEDAGYDQAAYDACMDSAEDLDCSTL